MFWVNGRLIIFMSLGQWAFAYMYVSGSMGVRLYVCLRFNGRLFICVSLAFAYMCVSELMGVCLYVCLLVNGRLYMCLWVNVCSFIYVSLG